jgi:nucleoside-diphosphate-sugar epimerase
VPRSSPSTARLLTGKLPRREPKTRSGYGVDNNSRADFFGPQGDTRWNQRRLESELSNFKHHELDIRDRNGILHLIDQLRPTAIVHSAAQPSHDLAAKIAFEDFDTNAVGTINLLEAAHRFVPASPFVHMSTNKVYGDAPNELPLVSQNVTMIANLYSQAAFLFVMIQQISAHPGVLYGCVSGVPYAIESLEGLS